MQEAPTIRQSTVAKDVLKLVAPGILLGLLAATLLSASRASALSLSANAHLSLLRPVSITSDTALLEAPSIVTVKVSGGSATPPSSTPPRLIGAVATANPHIPAASPVGGATPAALAAPATQATSLSVRPDPSTEAGSTQTDQKTAQQPGSTTEHIPQPPSFLGLTPPNGFGTLPESMGNQRSNFQAALVILTGIAVLFLGLATITTTKATRGSPHIP